MIKYIYKISKIMKMGSFMNGVSGFNEHCTASTQAAPENTPKKSGHFLKGSLAAVALRVGVLCIGLLSLVGSTVGLVAGLGAMATGGFLKGRLFEAGVQVTCGSLKSMAFSLGALTVGLFFPHFYCSKF